MCQCVLEWMWYFIYIVYIRLTNSDARVISPMSGLGALSMRIAPHGVQLGAHFIAAV